MTESDTAPVTAALPPRARLLHIGVPKSGTTFLQRAAAANRALLLEHGVRYPGTAINHRLPFLALMEKSLGWREEHRPNVAKWTRLMKEIEADRDRRVYLSNEAATLCTDEQAARFADALGPRMHVLITLRGFASLLSSNWQQRIKTGARISFDDWLTAVLAEPPTGIGVADHQRVDLAGVVDRWVKVVGADRVTVLIADKRRPTFLTEALADLLGLPRATLHADLSQGFSSNRSLSRPEVEMLRALNGVVRVANRVDWAQYSMLVRNGATARMLQMRTPGDEELPVVLPDWAAEIAAPRARAHADAIVASGARVLGDVDSLYGSAATTRAQEPAVTSVPIEAAAEAVAGAVSAATGRRAFFGADPEAANRPVGRMRPGRGGKVWVGPAASPEVRQAAKARRRGAKATAPAEAGTLVRVFGPERAERVTVVYRATENMGAADLLSVGVLRLWRRFRGTERLRGNPGGRRRMR